MSIESSFGRWVRRRRKALDLTQHELARRVACAGESLRKIEADVRRPSRQLAERLAEALELPPDVRVAFIRAARAELAVDMVELPIPASGALPTALAEQPSAGPEQTSKIIPFDRARRREAVQSAGSALWPSVGSLALPVRRHNIPASTLPFVGRDGERAELRTILTDRDYRLVTVVGPGGIGKTRLALQVATDLTHDPGNDFADGLYFVSLAATPSGDALVAAVAEAVGLSFSGANEPREQLRSFLHSREVLLVLDNFEHLVNDAELLSDLLKAAAGVTILVTSRVRLNLYEESCFDLQGLDVPSDATTTAIAGYSAVQLFVQRARRGRRDFTLDTEPTTIAQLCQLLSGFPLAIELAAGWVRTHSCREIADEIQHSVEFLATDLRNIPDRHRSMHAAFEHSWHLMSDEQRTAFARLSVFRGGFDRDAAKQVAGVSRATLHALVDASMLEVQPEGRYQIHVLLRQFGAEKLSVTEQQVRRSHSLHYAHYVRTRESHITTAQEAAALDEIGRELENILAAWEWAVASLRTRRLAATGIMVLGDCAPMLSRFFRLQGRYREGTQLFQQASASITARLNGNDPELAPEAGATVVAALWTCEAKLRYALGELDDAAMLALQSIRILRQHVDRRKLADALIILGLARVRTGEYKEAKAALHESLQASRAVDYAPGIANALNVLGMIAYYQDQLDTAEANFEECLAIYRVRGFQPGMVNLWSNLGSIYIRRQKYQPAKKLFEEALAVAQTDNDEFQVGILFNNLGTVARLEGRYDVALQYHEASLAIFRRLDHRRWTVESLNELGLTLIGVERFSDARSHLMEALKLGMVLHSTADVLDSLAGLGESMAQTGNRGMALVVLSFVAHHNVTQSMTREQSHARLVGLRDEMNEEEWTEGSAGGRSMVLEDVVNLVSG